MVLPITSSDFAELFGTRHQFTRGCTDNVTSSSSIEAGPRLERRIVLMDGGMGTTLEDVFSQDISNSPLWSARLIRDDPNILLETHLAFLRSGSRVISTATYQCAFEGFARAGIAETDAVGIMRKAVEIADEARKRFIDRQHEPSLGHPGEDDKYWECEPPLAVCLSLGPYGATLSPPQEFDGLYPPPYGPCGHASNPPNTTESNSPNPTTAFASSPTDDDTTPEDCAVDALSAFHLRRLRVFACDKETWAKVDCVAFETVPLVREAMAIRRTVGQLVSEMNVEGTEWEMKPWYISFVFPNGEFPQERWCGGPKMDVETVVRTTLMPTPSSSQMDIARPSGLGINCTEPRFVASIVKQMSEALGEVDGGDGPRPWLVLYPNGGETWDVDSRTYCKTLTIAGEASYEDQWATDVLQTIPDHHTQDQWGATNGPWGGTLLGGCCKTGPVHIEALARHIKGTSAR